MEELSGGPMMKYPQNRAVKGLGHNHGNSLHLPCMRLFCPARLGQAML